MAKGSLVQDSDYIPASTLHPKYQGHQLSLAIRQQPLQARVSTNNERDRKPIEPPPIIQIQLKRASSQEIQDFLQDPYMFLYVSLVNTTSEQEVSRSRHQVLSGQIVSSMYKLKDITDKDDGFFCFGDMSCRIEGEYRLKFSLFEIVGDGAINLMHTFSDTFRVYPTKTMPRLLDATFLSRSFSDQGVRIRIRKEHRVQTNKRKLSSRSDYSKEEDVDDSIATSPPQRHRGTATAHNLSSPEVSAQSTSSYQHQLEGVPYSTRKLETMYQEFNVHPHSPPLQHYELHSRQNSFSQPIHHYQKTGPTSQSGQDPLWKSAMEEKGLLPLSPRSSISAPHWSTHSLPDASQNYHRTSFQPQRSSSPIRLPPLHTIVGDETREKEKGVAITKGEDAGEVNAAVAIMQLSRHQGMDLLSQSSSHT